MLDVTDPAMKKVGASCSTNGGSCLGNNNNLGQAVLTEIPTEIGGMNF